jgi:hypothetical protein
MPIDMLIRSFCRTVKDFRKPAVLKGKKHALGGVVFF